jgi:hypothetical protein
MAKDHDNIVEEMMGEARNTRLTPRKWWGMLGRCWGDTKKMTWVVREIARDIDKMARA